MRSEEKSDLLFETFPVGIGSVT